MSDANLLMQTTTGTPNFNAFSTCKIAIQNRFSAKNHLCNSILLNKQTISVILRQLFGILEIFATSLLPFPLPFFSSPYVVFIAQGTLSNEEINKKEENNYEPRLHESNDSGKVTFRQLLCNLTCTNIQRSQYTKILWKRNIQIAVAYSVKKEF